MATLSIEPESDTNWPRIGNGRAIAVGDGSTERDLGGMHMHTRNHCAQHNAPVTRIIFHLLGWLFWGVDLIHHAAHVSLSSSCCRVSARAP